MLSTNEDIKHLEKAKRQKNILNITRNSIDLKILFLDLLESRQKVCGRPGRNLKTRSES